jgi:hypothetical protein
VKNEDALALLVVRLLMGQYRHVQKILANEGHQHTALINAAGIKDLIRKLEPESDDEMYRRDGWIFQMITWIAAKLVEPQMISAPPQSQSAMPGFDNLFVRTSGDKVVQVIIGEDKATINERSTITSQVWPEIRDFETGRRDHELLNEITPILERNSEELNVDECLKELFWEQIRSYRVCITVKESKDDASRKALFKGFDTVAVGSIDKRCAETFVVGELRLCMDELCKKAVKILLELQCMTK